MKILHIVDWYRTLGGAERLLFDTLQSLEEIGIQNVIMANDAEGNVPTNQRTEYFVKYLDHQIANYYKNFRTTNKVVKDIVYKENPDLIHIHNFQNHHLTKLLRKLKPTLRSIHDPRLYCFTNWRLLPESNDICPYPMGYNCLKNKCISYNNVAHLDLYKIFLLKTCQKIDGVIVESEVSRECLIQNGFDKNKIFKLPNFTNVIPDNELQIRRAKYFNKKNNVVLFVGRANYEKGADVLIDAISMINDIPITTYILTGYGPHEDNIKKKVIDLKLEDKIILPGAQNYDSTRNYYAMADVVVIPSVWLENFCLVGIEAMMNKKPVIGSNVGGIPDWLVDGETGFLFPFKNAKVLAEKIKILLNNKDLAEKMGENGRKRALELYTKQQYLPRLLDIYKQVISN